MQGFEREQVVFGVELLFVGLIFKGVLDKVQQAVNRDFFRVPLE